MRIVYYKRHEINFSKIGSRICKEYFYLEDRNIIFDRAEGTEGIENILFPSDENFKLFNEARNLAKGIIPVLSGVLFSDLKETDYDFPIWMEDSLKDLNSKFNQSDS